MNSRAFAVCRSFFLWALHKSLLSQGSQSERGLGLTFNVGAMPRLQSPPHPPLSWNDRLTWEMEAQGLPGVQTASSLHVQTIFSLQRATRINTVTEVCCCIYTVCVGCTSLINLQYYSKLCAKGYGVSWRVCCWHSNWLQTCTTSSRSKWKRSAIDQVNPWGSDRETHWQSESFSGVTKLELQDNSKKKKTVTIFESVRNIWHT